jgi:hypothetical protein
MIFQYGTQNIRVESADAAALGWLREFLTPSFAVVESGRVDHTVDLVVDDHAYAELLNGERSEGGELDCFALDSRMVRLPLWRSTPEDRVVFDPLNQVFCRMRIDGSGGTVLTAPRNLAARFALMRLVREMAMVSLRARGALALHAAALSTPAGAIAIGGPKLAGKTTVLLHALRACGGCFVANDRIVVDLGRNEPMLRAMPTIVTVREPTLCEIPHLRESVLRSGYDHRLALGESPPRGSRTATPRQGGPVDLSPAQFCSLLGVHASGHGALRALLFPVFGPTEKGIQVRVLSAAAAAQRLQSVLFGAGSRDTSADLCAGALPFRADTNDALRLCLALSERVPAFEWQLGPDAYRDRKMLAGLVEQLLEPRSTGRAALSVSKPTASDA